MTQLQHNLWCVLAVCVWVIISCGIGLLATYTPSSSNGNYERGYPVQTYEH